MRHVARSVIARAVARQPDQIIGGHDDPYLLRWYFIPRNVSLTFLCGALSAGSYLALRTPVFEAML